MLKSINITAAGPACMSACLPCPVDAYALFGPTTIAVCLDALWLMWRGRCCAAENSRADGVFADVFSIIDDGDDDDDG